MTSYNFKIKTALVASLLLGLTACMNRDPHVTENGATFYVDDITPTVASYSVNKNDDVSQKFINMKACFKDNAQKSIIMNVPFAIYADNVELIHMNYDVTPPTRLQYKTDRDGCITWQELFEFNPKASDQQVLLNRTFKALSGHEGSVDAKLAYNPYHDEIKYLKLGFAGQAVEKGNVTYSLGAKFERVNTLSGGNISTQVDVSGKLTSAELVPLSIKSIGLTYLNRDFDNYQISPTLGLTIAHDYQVVFGMYAIRKTFDHGTFFEPINAGNFRFHILIMKDGFNSTKMSPDEAPKNVVGSTTFDAVGSGGDFRSLVIFRFDNIASLASRLTIVVTAESIDQKDTFKTSTFEGLMYPVAGYIGQGLTLFPSKLDGMKLTQRYEGLREESFKAKGLDLLLQQANFKAVTPATTNLHAVTGYNFASVLKSKTLPSSTDPIFAQALCFAYFNASMTDGLTNAFETCKRNAVSPTPDKMMTVLYRDFVEKVDDPKPTASGLPLPETLSVSSGLNFSDSNTQEQASTTKNDKSAYSGLGAEFNLFGLIEKIPVVGVIVKALNLFNFSANTGMKVSFNKEWYYSTGATQDQSQTATVGVSKALSIYAEGFKFKLKVTTRSCLLIVPTAELLKLMSGPAPEGKVVCNDQAESGVREETYWFLNETTGGATPLSDGMSQADNPMRMFIRGQKSYSLFSHLLLQSKMDVKLQKMSIETRADWIRDQLNEYITQEFPGMYDPTPEATADALPVEKAPPMGTPSTNGRRVGTWRDLLNPQKAR